MNEIRKYQKQINKNGWQCRIQKWAFDIDAETTYMGYCPFFWMTLLCVLVSPIIWLVRCILSIFGSVGDIVESLVPNFEKKETLKKVKPLKRKSPEFDELEYALDRADGDILRLKYPEWVKENPNWQEEVREVRAKIAEAKAKRKKEAKEKAIKIQKRRDQLAGYARLTVKPLLVISSLGCAWVLWHVAKVLITYWAITLSVLGCSLLGWAFIVLVIKFCGIVKNTLNRTKATKRPKVKRETQPGPISNAFDAVINFFKFVWEFVSKAFSFAKEVVVMSYKKECPLIQWDEEESKPIEKR